jgi:hypothetical protein
MRRKDARHESNCVKLFSSRPEKEEKESKVAGVIGRDAAGHVVINNSYYLLFCSIIILLYF